MKRTIGIETKDTNSNTETESLVVNTPGRRPDKEDESSPNVSVTSEEVACQIKAVTDSLSQKIAQLCKIMHKLRSEQVIRRHKETTSQRTTT